MKTLGTQVEDMRSLIIEAHEGQYYGDHDYVYHLLGVRQAFDTLFKGKVDPDTYLRGVAASYGHDLQEETWVTKQYLLDSGYDEQTVKAIDLCTKVEGLPYTNYLRCIARDDLAFMVKVSDTYANMTESIVGGDLKRSRKYSEQLGKLYKLRREFLDAKGC